VSERLFRRRKLRRDNGIVAVIVAVAGSPKS
jgi:hypothetical protein